MDMWNYIKVAIVLGVVGALAGILFLFSGLFPVGADEHHSRPVHWALETLRERSILAASADIAVPALNDAGMLMIGGQDYNDMCAGCHLKPGTTTSDLSRGLYPQPPNLATASANAPADPARAAARQFWIIKHGVKASGMPAWGYTHDDQRIWAMVAFLQRLPTLTPDQYQILTARGRP